MCQKKENHLIYSRELGTEINKTETNQRKRRWETLKSFLFSHLAGVKSLEILKVSTGRDVHIWVARFGWAEWSL